MDFCIAFLLFCFFLSLFPLRAIMVNKIMKQPESQKSKIHNLDRKKIIITMRNLFVFQERRGRGVVHTALLLVYYYGAAITSSMRAPWSNAEDLGKTATRSGVEQTRKKDKRIIIINRAVAGCAKRKS